jgi:translation initiation factor 1
MNRLFKNIAFLFILLPAVVFAQDDWEKPAGGIEDARVVIEKEKVINLRPVSRRFKSIQFEVPKAVPITLNYQLPEVNAKLPSLQVIVRPKTMKTPPLDKLFSFNGKLGYGNYRTPLVLLNIGTKRSDEYMLDAYLNHISSGRGPNKIGNGLDNEYNTNFGGSGKYFLNNFTLNSDFNYRNYIYNIYGYDPDQMIASPESFFIRQNLNVFSFDIGLKDNNLKNAFDNEINLNLNYLVNSNNDPSEPAPRHEYNELRYGIEYAFEGNFDANLKDILTQAKKKCASGGTVRGNEIELQGDHRNKVKEALEEMGFTVEVT